MGRRKAIILTSITILFLCSMGCQSATFGKGICCYVGDVKLSDTTISVKLTFDNDTTGTLEISKSNKALGKNKIEEFYFASLEAQWKFSGDKHKSLQVDTERTFHQRYPLAML